jgi:predicted ribonuclease YlaK
LQRNGWDHSIPSTVEQALQKLRSTFAELQALLDLAVHGGGELLAVPDTGVLLRDPDPAAYATVIGTATYTVVLLPTVLSELDDLKDRGRTPEIRDAAESAVRRLKGFRDRGDLRTGVKVQGNVRLKAEHRECNPRDVLGWLDPTVPDDRILGAALDLQSRAPASSVVLVTTDFNLENKAAVAGLPFVEPVKITDA